MNRTILPLMKYAALSLLALLAMGSTAGPARADAIPAACMSATSSSKSMGEANLALTNYKATLAGESAHLAVGQIVAQDKQGHLTLSNLRDANALISFGLLKLVHNGSPSACHSVNGRPALNSLRDALHQGAVAELVWTKVALSGAKDHYMADRINATLRAGQNPGSIDINFSASGLTTPRGSALPGRLSTTLTIPEDMLDSTRPPSGKVTISSLVALWEKGRLDGNGWISPGHTFGASTGELHLAITDLKPLMSTIRPVLPTSVFAALSIAQFMGHHQGDQVMWDLALDGGILKVNSIPIPVN